MDIHTLLKTYLNPFLYLAVIAAFWVSFAPRQIGGQFLYIIISGNSMEPFLMNGDLAILRPGTHYQVGDVILYHHPDLGPVIHRIIATGENGYIVKGDHNQWVDMVKPTQAEITGKLWFHVNSAGKVIEQFRTPIGAALLAGMIGIFVIWPVREHQNNAVNLLPLVSRES